MTRAVLAGLLLAASSAAAFPVEVLQANGPPENRIDLVVLGDGYPQGAQAKLTQDAQALIAGLFGVTPFQEYRGLFNVKLIKAVSNEAGADHPATGVFRDTAFDAAYECAGIGRLICVNTTKVLTAAATDVPEFDLAVVVVNDPLYGGSGGSVPVASVDALAVQILQHELSHNLGGLADEYESPFPSYPPCSSATDCAEPNATLRTNRAQVKWNAWIAPSTPVPTPENGSVPGVGLFEGCRYLTSGIYRPVESACAMRTLGAPFCPVCAEGLVRAFWNRAQPIDTVSPPDATVSLCGEVTFQVGHPPLPGASWSYVWTLGGVPQAGGQQSLTVPASWAGASAQSLQVTVQDGTALVRTDPQNLLRDTHAWSLVRHDCGAYACAPDGRTCRTQCSGATDCAPGHLCEGGACLRSDGGTPATPDGGGPTPDGGTPSDLDDAGTPGPDGGPEVPGPSPGDGGGDGEGDAEAGCGCQATGMAPWAFLAAVALALPRPRGRRSSRRRA